MPALSATRPFGALSRRPDRLAAALAGLAALTLAGGAGAAQQPVTVNPLFVDPPPKAGAPARPLPAARCGLRLTELKDVRRAPETLGIVSGRAVRAPPDTAAWLHSMAEALGPRGFDVSYGPAPAETGLTAQVSLTSAWVTDVSTNKTANLVLHARVARPGAEPVDRDYRGDLTKMNWASTESELKGLVDRVIAEALDHMARDLAELCGTD